MKCFREKWKTFLLFICEINFPEKCPWLPHSYFLKVSEGKKPFRLVTETHRVLWRHSHSQKKLFPHLKKCRFIKLYFLDGMNEKRTLGLLCMSVICKTLRWKIFRLGPSLIFLTISLKDNLNASWIFNANEGNYFVWQMSGKRLRGFMCYIQLK